MRSLVCGLAVGLALSLPSAAVLAQAPAAEPVPGEDPVVVMAEPAPIASAPPAAENDYPTAVRAEYVFACMATNGQTQDALTRCSCSIDQIAGILPYDAYVEAETVLRMRLAAGERGAMFRGTPVVREIAATLRRAQAEAEILCF
jgi:hypothetical protein